MHYSLFFASSHKIRADAIFDWVLSEPESWGYLMLEINILRRSICFGTPISKWWTHLHIPGWCSKANLRREGVGELPELLLMTRLSAYILHFSSHQGVQSPSLCLMRQTSFNVLLTHCISKSWIMELSCHTIFIVNSLLPGCNVTLGRKWWSNNLIKFTFLKNRVKYTLTTGWSSSLHSQRSLTLLKIHWLPRASISNDGGHALCIS